MTKTQSTEPKSIEPKSTEPKLPESNVIELKPKELDTTRCILKKQHDKIMVGVIMAAWIASILI
jgi:hypothetical protein